MTSSYLTAERRARELDALRHDVVDVVVVGGGVLVQPFQQRTAYLEVPQALNLWFARISGRFGESMRNFFIQVGW